jgi:hypothetical protein
MPWQVSTHEMTAAKGPFTWLLLGALLHSATGLAQWELQWSGSQSVLTGPVGRRSHGMAISGDWLLVHGTYPLRNHETHSREHLTDLCFYNLIRRVGA